MSRHFGNDLETSRNRLRDSSEVKRSGMHIQPPFFPHFRASGLSDGDLAVHKNMPTLLILLRSNPLAQQRKLTQEGEAEKSSC